MPIYASTVDELARLRDQAAARALEQRLEAENADFVARRDERVVAGEDTERAATNAANLAKQELGGAAGRGAAALAGMEAAAKAREQVFSDLLQRARTRKDLFEQKGVDRRKQAFDTSAQASSIEQARLRDLAIANDMAKLQAERETIQLDQARKLNADKERLQLAAGQEARKKAAEEEEEEEEDWIREHPSVIKVKDPETSPASIDKVSEPEKQRYLDPIRNFDEINGALDEAGFPSYIAFSTQYPGALGEQKTRDHLYNRSNQLSEFLTWYPYWYDGLADELKAKVPNHKEHNKNILWSDANLKDVYKDAGHNAGKIGNAKRSAKKNMKKAEEMYEDMGNGINEELVRRYSI